MNLEDYSDQELRELITRAQELLEQRAYEQAFRSASSESAAQQEAERRF